MLKDTAEAYEGKTESEAETYFANLKREKKEMIPFVKMIEDLSSMTNSMGLSEKTAGEYMADTFNRQHRTLQASMMRVMAAFIQEVAKVEYTDARNEDAINWAKKVAEIESYMRFI